MDTVPLLEFKNISKSFPGVKALQNVDFSLYSGEILGLSGENGAGKSTLIKILGGVHQPDEGSVLLEGKPVSIKGISDGFSNGVSIIYQELSLVPELSVAENIYLGAVPRHAGKIDFKKLYSDTERILSTLGLDLSPKTKVGSLTISACQLVEIGKALARDAKILVMDEPTSSLGRDDAQRLFLTMKSLKEQGYAIIYISHRLEELFEICDRITVLRDGKVVETRPTAEWDTDSLVFAMVNRRIEQFYPKAEIPIGEQLLRVENLENDYIRSADLTLCSGEIVGIAGLMGSGRSELLKTICGALAMKGGSILVQGNVCKIHSPHDALSYGIALVPENRKEEGLVLNSTVKENIVLSVLWRIAKLFLIKRSTINSTAENAIDLFNIKTPSRNQRVVKLSGGNQQKIIFARIAESKPKILLLDEPTRGIDIGSKVEIYNKIMSFAEAGAGVLLVSSDMSEVLGLSDRIYVMREGEIVAQVNTAETSSKEIMDYATGGK